MKTTLLLFLLMSMHQLIAQTTQSQKIDEFITQKGDGFDIAYDKKDEKAYNTLLSEYLVLHEKLSVDEKKCKYP